MHMENGNCHDEKGHRHGGWESNRTRLAVTIFFNMIITLSEFIGGMISGSLSLISDAGHNLSDVLALMLGYAGEKITERDPTKRFTFGFKRFEVLIALVNALTLVGVGIFIIYEAVRRVMTPVDIDIQIMIIIATIGLAGNVMSIIILSRKRNSNLNMKAAFLHMLYDAVSSAGVIIAGVIIYFTKLYWVDIIFSIIIVIMIFWSSKDIVLESLRIFLQGAPDHIDVDIIYSRLLEISGISSIHGLHIWSINSTEIFLSSHIIVNDEDNNIDRDSLIKKVNDVLEQEFGIFHTTLQLERSHLCRQEAGDCCR